MDLAEPEATSLLAMMDLDRDGAVSVDDFMVLPVTFTPLTKKVGFCL